MRSRRSCFLPGRGRGRPERREDGLELALVEARGGAADPRREGGEGGRELVGEGAGAREVVDEGEAGEALQARRPQGLSGLCVVQGGRLGRARGRGGKRSVLVFHLYIRALADELEEGRSLEGLG